jgi:hypothetical protein
MVRFDRTMPPLGAARGDGRRDGEAWTLRRNCKLLGSLSDMKDELALIGFGRPLDGLEAATIFRPGFGRQSNV